MEPSLALDEIWQRVKRLNRYVQDEEPWKLSKDEAEAGHLDQVLYSLAEGLRVVSVLLLAFVPASAERLLAALGREDPSLDTGGLRRAARRRPHQRAATALPAGGAPRGRGRLDGPPAAPPGGRHPLPPGFLRAPGRELLERARAAGVRRVATVGTDGPSIQRALAAAQANADVSAIVGRHPHETAGFGAADLEEIERAAADPVARAIGETGLDYYRDHAPREDQRRAFEAQLELAGRLGLPVAIHTRAAEDDTFALLREHAERLPAVILHCFSAPERVEECVERGYLCSFAGNVTYPKATDLQEAARELPERAPARGDRSPYLAPQPLRGKPNEPANVTHTARWVAELRGVSYEALERAVEANAARVFGW